MTMIDILEVRRNERKAADPAFVIAGMNLDVDAQSVAIAKATAEGIEEMLTIAARQKQAGCEWTYVRRELANDLVPLVKAYITEALNDGSLWSDWENEYMREVIFPVLGDKVFGEVRYSGFGARSVTMRFKNCPRTPEFGTMLCELGRQYKNFWKGIQSEVQS